MNEIRSVTSEITFWKKKKKKNKVQMQNIMAFLYYIQDSHNKKVDVFWDTVYLPNFRQLFVKFLLHRPYQYSYILLTLPKWLIRATIW